MPIDFLAAAERERLNCFPEPISDEDLRRLGTVAAANERGALRRTIQHDPLRRRGTRRAGQMHRRPVNPCGSTDEWGARVWASHYCDVIRQCVSR